MQKAAALDVKTLARYPFLPQARDHFVEPDLLAYLKTTAGRLAANKGREKVAAAIDGKEPPCREVGDPKLEVYTYVMARVLASCCKGSYAVKRLIDYETSRVMAEFRHEQNNVRETVEGILGFDPDATEVPVVTWVEMTAGTKNTDLKLAGRTVHRGRVTISTGERQKLLRMMVERAVSARLPLQVPADIKAELAPLIEMLDTDLIARNCENLGPVSIGAFPPCVSTLLQNQQGGKNLTHPGRFFLATFMQGIGMSVEEIVTTFCSQPDFDRTQTEYQVRHIIDHEYKTNTCASCKTMGLCHAGDDAICKDINHPFSYYLKKKKKEKKP